MPRKERPAPLSDSIFRAKLGQQAEVGLIGVRDAADEAIPVHNTFIQFGASECADGSEKKGLTTAPAWVGPSLRNVISSALTGTVKEEDSQKEDSARTDTSEAASNVVERLGLPKKVPVIKYALSGSSARAVGLPGDNAVLASCGQLERSLQPAKFSMRCATESGPSSTSTTQDTSASNFMEDDLPEDDDDDSIVSRPFDLLELPSRGSAKHAEGLCKRCCFFPRGRCLNGYDCEFCHFEHEKRKRKKKKSKDKEGANPDASPDGDNEASGSDEEEVSAPSCAFDQPSTGDSLCPPFSFPGLQLALRPPPPAEPAPPPRVPPLLGSYGMLLLSVPQTDLQTSGPVPEVPTSPVTESFEDLVVAKSEALLPDEPVVKELPKVQPQVAKASPRDSPRMPRKERPAPLKLGPPAEADKISARESVGKISAREAAEEAIPVHNTFIQFGAAERIDGCEKKGLTTAPAWVGPSLQSTINSAVTSLKEQELQPEDSPRTGAAEASASGVERLGSPKKVPVIKYTLSGSSARAVGLPGESAVLASCGKLDGPLSEDFVRCDQDDEDDSGDEGRPVPLGELPSLGSAKHSEGLCKRCCFYPKGRCMNGYDCEFCHYEHEKRKRKKKKKSKKNKEEDDPEGADASGSDEEVSTPTGARNQPSTGDSSCPPAGLHGLFLRPPPPFELAPPSPADPAPFGPFEGVMWNAPQLDAETLRSVAGLPLPAPSAVLQATPRGAGDSITNFTSGFGAAIATAAFVLEPTTPSGDQAATTPGASSATAGSAASSTSESTVPTYAPLPADSANMWAFAAAASGLQANGTVPPTAAPANNRPPPR